MDIERALLAAIHDSPTDDTIWLVLADWLEEQGELPRAELLRLHRALRGLDEGPRRDQLEARVQQLLQGGVRPCVPALVNSVGIELALIPPGVFWLGSPDTEEGRYNDESPRRLVEITQPFYLGVYPVTQEEYERVMGSNPSSFCATGQLSELVGGRDTRRYPVEHVSWDDAVDFCRKLSELPLERDAGRVYRLPSEAEWEYACRGGAALSCPFPWGRAIKATQANFRDAPQPRTVRRRLTTAVGSYLPNGFGLYDMVGNTWEWCSDWYSSNAYANNPPCDPQGPPDGERRNARGGTYNLETRRVRSADRSSFEPEQKDSGLGFRVACGWRPSR